ncbi:hypothetical protein EDC02_5188 [Micromonospora sp. Llam0]|nr:hypothetical protein EDC02_5188 [Micromonospora sp. Llam0]
MPGASTSVVASRYRPVGKAQATEHQVLLVAEGEFSSVTQTCGSTTSAACAPYALVLTVVSGSLGMKWTPPGDAGLGLGGMAEGAVSYGGTVSAGPAPDGG